MVGGVLFSDEALRELTLTSAGDKTLSLGGIPDLVYVSDLSDRGNLEKFLSHPTLTTLWPIRSEAREADAARIATAISRARAVGHQSLIMGDHDPASERQSFSLRHSHERYEVITAFGELARRAPCFANFSAICETAASELLTNAIFNAHRDQFGKPKVSDRKIAVTFESTIEVSIGEDLHHVWFSIQDPFGTFSREALIRSLLKSSAGESLMINMGEGGSGIGLYMVFRWAAQLLFILESGKSTRVLFKALKTRRNQTFDAQRAVLEIIVA